MTFETDIPIEQLYFAKFDGINYVNYPEDIKIKAQIEMQKAINGKRGALTDKEFGQEIPEGAEA